MTVWVRTILSCLALVVLCLGCSGNDEPPPRAAKPKVVKRIIKPPPPKPVQAVEAVETPAPAEKAAQPVAQPEKKAEGKETPPPAAEKPAKPAVPMTSASPPAQEAGVYVAKKGETLSDIAKRKDVYGDPLKWAILYRLNAKKLAKLGNGPGLPDQVLPEGLRLKITTPDEAKENLEKRAKDLWIVNILSARNLREIVPPAVTLMQKGYPVYITSAKIKGKDWMRLRLGFFDTRKSATAEGEKVMALLRFRELWTTKISKDELKDYGRF